MTSVDFVVTSCVLLTSCVLVVVVAVAVDFVCAGRCGWRWTSCAIVYGAVLCKLEIMFEVLR